MKYQSKLPNLETTIFSVMSALAHKHDAINLSQGYPNFPSDQRLIDMVYNAMNTGHNQYAPMPGQFKLREAIAAKFDLLYDTSYHPEKEITVTAGATQAIYSAITAFVRPGDEVIIFCPAYDCYDPAVRLCGGIPVAIQMKHPDYMVDWDEVRAAVSPETKMIVINTPHNPTGTVLSGADMLQLQNLTDGTDIIVLSDEVYEHIIFDGEEHQSVCRFGGLRSRSLITASFGKTFHNTGWKLGYCCAPEDLMEEFRKVHQFNVFSVNHPIQAALAEYLHTEEHYLSLSAFYQEKRDLFLSFLKDSRFKFIPSKGTYFQMLDYSEISDENDVALAKRWTIDNKIASIPVSVFNERKLDNKVLRFCFAKTDETLKQGAEILCGF